MVNLGFIGALAALVVACAIMAGVML